MKACNDITFLSNYWSEAKNIAYKIKKELPSMNMPSVSNTANTGMLTFIQYKDMGDTWSVNDILTRINGSTPTLKVLADKISYMILKGRGNDVPVMIGKICTGRIKSLTHISKSNKSLKEQNEVYHNEYLGRGHFRWNYQAYTLTVKEIAHIRKYFKID